MTKGTGCTMDVDRGCWIAAHSDWSGFVVFGDELPALRHAVVHTMEVVVFVPWGGDPQEIARIGPFGGEDRNAPTLEEQARWVRVSMWKCEKNHITLTDPEAAPIRCRASAGLDGITCGLYTHDTGTRLLVVPDGR